MIDTEAFKNYVEAFYNNSIQDKFKNCKDIKDAISTAVDLAYQDTKRTLKGIGENEGKKNAALDSIIKNFKEYFDGTVPENADKFDEKHSKLCNCWHNEFEDSPLGAHGKAQKIINMTFKYLYCYCNEKNDKISHFKYCHMPLDSYTLEWFKRYLSKNHPQKLENCNQLFKKNDKEYTIIKGKIDSWSNLESSSKTNTYLSKDGKHYSYEFYQTMIRDYIDINKLCCSPLQLEFIVWPKTQLEIAAESFNKSIDYFPENVLPLRKETDKTICEALDTIKAFIDKC